MNSKSCSGNADLNRGRILLLTAAALWSLAGIFIDRKSTRLNSSHSQISYAVFCLKKKKQYTHVQHRARVDRLTRNANRTRSVAATHQLRINITVLRHTKCRANAALLCQLATSCM